MPPGSSADWVRRKKNWKLRVVSIVISERVHNYGN